MASVPGFDPNAVPDHFARLRARARTRRSSNRAAQSGYPPGSTFKVVTATAALDSGPLHADTRSSTASRPR